MMLKHKYTAIKYTIWQKYIKYALYSSRYKVAKVDNTHNSQVLIDEHDQLIVISTLPHCFHVSTTDLKSMYARNDNDQDKVITIYTHV